MKVTLRLFGWMILTGCLSGCCGLPVSTCGWNGHDCCMPMDECSDCCDAGPGPGMVPPNLIPTPSTETLDIPPPPATLPMPSPV